MLLVAINLSICKYYKSWYFFMDMKFRVCIKLNPHFHIQIYLRYHDTLQIELPSNMAGRRKDQPTMTFTFTN